MRDYLALINVETQFLQWHSHHCQYVEPEFMTAGQSLRCPDFTQAVTLNIRLWHRDVAR
jgi:hypothetical protein